LLFNLTNVCHTPGVDSAVYNSFRLKEDFRVFCSWTTVIVHFHGALFPRLESLAGFTQLEEPKLAESHCRMVGKHPLSQS
jgi:hypothetical protein